MKKWEIIRKAKKHLAKNHSEVFDGDSKYAYICWTISRVTPGKWIEVKYQIFKDIDEWLDGETTYGCWLLKHGVVTQQEYEDDDRWGYPKRQAGRLAWMNWMQAYYKGRNE